MLQSVVAVRELIHNDNTSFEKIAKNKVIYFQPVKITNLFTKVTIAMKQCYFLDFFVDNSVNKI
mgnify:CR=1 FL=1